MSSNIVSNRGSTEYFHRRILREELILKHYHDFCRDSRRTRPVFDLTIHQIIFERDADSTISEMGTVPRSKN